MLGINRRAAKGNVTDVDQRILASYIAILDKDGDYDVLCEDVKRLWAEVNKLLAAQGWTQVGTGTAKATGTAKRR